MRKEPARAASSGRIYVSEGLGIARTVKTLFKLNPISGGKRGPSVRMKIDDWIESFNTFFDRLVRPGEVVLAVFFCPAVAMFGMWALRPLWDMSNVSKALTAFAVALCCFHLGAWMLRGRLPRRVLSLIDYAYLTAAAAGIIAMTATVDSIADKHYLEGTSTILTWIQESGEEKVKDFHADYCVEKQPEFYDSKPSEATCRQILNWVKVIKRRDRAQASNMLNEFERIADDAMRKSSDQFLLVQRVNEVGSTLQHFKETLDDVYRFSPGYWGSEVRLRLFGALVLAFGLALRITRASIEFFEWLEPAEPQASE